MIKFESGLKLKPGEEAAIIDLFKNPKKVFTTGVTVGGVKYKGSKGDKSFIIGKKGATGVIIARTNMFMIISTYNKKMQPDKAVKLVEGITNMLKQTGF